VTLTALYGTFSDSTIQHSACIIYSVLASLLFSLSLESSARVMTSASHPRSKRILHHALAKGRSFGLSLSLLCTLLVQTGCQALPHYSRAPNSQPFLKQSSPSRHTLDLGLNCICSGIAFLIICTSVCPGMCILGVVR
jgi:hypothetical protein